MLRVALKIGTMLLKDLFKRFGIDRLVIVCLRLHVNLRYFLYEKFLFLFISEILLL